METMTETNLNNICTTIREKISKQQTHELFHEIEDKIMKACSIFINNWKPFTDNFNEFSNKDEFVSETRLLFSTIYLHYADEQLLKEVHDIIKNEPKGKEEAEEYLYFIESLKTIQFIEKTDLDNPPSEKMQKMNHVISYLKKKSEELKDLNNTMKQMNNSLEKLTTTLENFVECNKTLNRIECLENELNNKEKND